ncbi:MAG TPA: hypothetical protein VGL41_16325 [Roseiarcus sp.]
MRFRHIFACAALVLVNGAAAHAASKLSWDGTWAGTLNNEPVSVTIAEGKVVGYTIRGFSPLPIESASVSGRSVSLVIGAAYRVTITKKGEKNAVGLAHGPLGDGVASLIRQ